MSMKQYAKQIELFLDSTLKKSSFANRSPNFLNSKSPLISGGGEGKSREKGPPITKPTTNPTGNLTLDQKRALGLCFRCNEKWGQGHKCGFKGIHAMKADEEEEAWQQEHLQQLLNKQDEEQGSVEEECEEQTVINFCAPCSSSNTRTLKFKGEIC